MQWERATGTPPAARVPDPHGWVWPGALDHARGSVYAGGFRRQSTTVPHAGNGGQDWMNGTTAPMEAHSIADWLHEEGGLLYGARFRRQFTPDRTVRGRVRGGVAAHPSRSGTRDAGVGARGGPSSCLSRCKGEGLPCERSGPPGEYVAELPDRLVCWGKGAGGLEERHYERMRYVRM